MSRYFKVVLCLVVATHLMGPFEAYAGRQGDGQASTGTRQGSATGFVDSTNDSDQEELRPSELDLRLIEIESEFHRKRRRQCASSAVWEGSKLASYVAVNCAGAYLATNLIGPMKAMLSDLTGSLASTPANDDPDTRSSSGTSTIKDFAIVSAGTAIAGAFGQDLLGKWFQRGSRHYQAFISNFRGTQVGDFLGNVKLMEILSLADQLELKYQLLKELLPSESTQSLAQLKGLRRFIDQANSLADFMLGKVTSVNSPQVFLNPTDGLTPLGREYAQHYLDIPLSKKRFSERDKMRIQQNLDHYFGETFDPRLKKFFLGQVHRIVDNSLMSQKSTHKDRVNYLFQGSAGTGKTATAQALASALGFGFCKIEGASLKPEHFSKSATASQGGASGSSTVPQIAGALFECMINSIAEDGKRYRSIVVAIDEADHLTRSELHGQGFEQVFKTMLDDPSFYDTAMGIQFDISDFIFILIANGPLIQSKPGHEKHIQAFNERYETVEFSATTIEQRKIIAKDNFLIPMARERHYEPTEADVTFVTDVLTPYDLERNEGVRILKHIIDAFIIHRKGEQEIAQFDYQRAFSTQGVVAEKTMLQAAVASGVPLSAEEIEKLRRLIRAAEYLIDPTTVRSGVQMQQTSTDP